MSSTAGGKPLISAGFDGGNGELLDSAVLSDGTFEARLNMGKEPYTEGTDKREHHQWFYFKASNTAATQRCRFRLVNAGSSSYPAYRPHMTRAWCHAPLGLWWGRSALAPVACCGGSDIRAWTLRREASALH